MKTLILAGGLGARLRKIVFEFSPKLWNGGKNSKVT